MTNPVINGLLTCLLAIKTTAVIKSNECQEKGAKSRNRLFYFFHNYNF